jgi:isocitrate dehydrogenase
MKLVATLDERVAKNAEHRESAEVQFALCEGDGIGPEITRAVMRILSASGLHYEAIPVDMGEKIYLAGQTSGIGADDWKKLEAAKVLLKAPITTPRGGGYKSLNVTLRKAFGLFANVRPVRSYPEYIPGKAMDLVIVRENEEDTYAGIEHRQTAEVTQCLKLITFPGTEKILHYAFALAEGVKKHQLTLMTKDNIMKLTDGVFTQLFKEMAPDFPNIKTESMIIDIGTARLAERPGDFQVVVAPNLYGDIISDVAAEVSGSVGLCGSANFGENFAMFEAVHGSAPDIAGQNIANPSGMLAAAIMMLRYLGQGEIAARIKNAWLVALEDGYRTADIYGGEGNERKATTTEFAEAVVDRLGKLPTRVPAAQALQFPAVAPSIAYAEKKALKRSVATVKELRGVDIFLDYSEANRNPDTLGRRLESLAPLPPRLSMVSNRGVKVYPDGNVNTWCSDHWRCRFIAETMITHSDVLNLLASVEAAGLDFVKTEGLYWFNGKPGYSLGQGE